MRRTLTGLCLAAVFGLGPGAFAQQPSTGGPDTFSLTGCLDRRNDGTYELRGAHMGPLGADTSPGTPGTTSSATGTAGATSAAKARVDSVPSTWILKSTTDLAPHIGHSVQVTGRLSAPAGSGGSDTATTSAPTTTATGARMKRQGEDARSVDVESVRMISRSCP